MSLGPKICSKLWDWLRSRYPMDEVVEFSEGQLHKPLPPHVGFWHTFGSLSLFLFINQIVTGILLMVYYRPTTETAFESVRYIMTKAYFGWLIRGLHDWGSTLMIFCVLVHMTRTFFMGAYKKPREMTWVLGVCILGCTITFGFTGYLLPWNQLSYWATQVGTEIAGVIPWAGDYIMTLLRGGTGVSGETLARFYVVHVVVLPWVLTGLVVVHLVFMRVQNLATLEKVGEEKPIKKGIPFYPHHILKEGVIFSLLMVVMFALIVLWPSELGEKSDPLKTPEGIKPEWYFLSTYQLLKYFPKMIGLVVSLVPIALLLFWPFLDRTPARHPRQRKVSVAIGVVGLVIALVFGVLGYYSERTVTFGGKKYHLDMYCVPHAVESKSAH